VVYCVAGKARKLTITASDKYGLPTAMDDEVILGLIQLTGKADFSERIVLFTRYELLKPLNWTDDTRNYNRLEQSLNRWLGVTLYYDKSWHCSLFPYSLPEARDKHRKFRFKHPLLTLDSTVIPVCVEMFEWAKYVKTKGAVKLRCWTTAAFCLGTP
jgi:hypothetical protein